MIQYQVLLLLEVLTTYTTTPHRAAQIQVTLLQVKLIPPLQLLTGQHVLARHDPQHTVQAHGEDVGRS